MSNYSLGYDYFSADSTDNVEYMTCKVCKEYMDCDRGVLQTKGRWGDIPINFQRKVDIFTCSNVGKNWHDQVITLMKEMERTSSKKLTDIFNDEINEILSTKTPTKPHVF